MDFGKRLKRGNVPSKAGIWNVVHPFRTGNNNVSNQEHTYMTVATEEAVGNMLDLMQCSPSNSIKNSLF